MDMDTCSSSDEGKNEKNNYLLFRLRARISIHAIHVTPVALSGIRNYYRKKFVLLISYSCIYIMTLLQSSQSK